MTPWISACTSVPLQKFATLAAPVGLRELRLVTGRGRRREHRDELAVLPLDEVEAAVGRAVGVPAEVAQQGRPSALVQRGDDGRVVDLPGLLRDLLDDLADRVGLGAAVV